MSQFSHPRQRAAVAHADVTSANIVGYQNVDVPTGYYIFTPTFQNIGSDAQFDLNTLKPYLPSGTIVSRDATVSIFLLGDDGNYSGSIAWYGSKGKWVQNGEDVLDNTVMVGAGKGFAINNAVKVNDSGVEVARNGKTTTIHFQVSGQVDLVCQNIAPAGYMINGNSTPVQINIKGITPTLPSGNAVTRDATVSIFMLNEGGNYTGSIAWYGSTKKWVRNGEEISDEEGALAIGQGFAINNTVKVNDSGVEVARNGKSTIIYLALPSPIK